MSTDDKILRQLSDDYIHSDQNSDVARYEEFLAEDFTATLPDLVFRNRQEFLDLIAQPREALYTDTYSDATEMDVRRGRDSR